MLSLIVDDDIILKPLAADDAESVFELITANRAYMDEWMRWTPRIQSADDARAYIQRFAEQYAVDQRIHLGLWVGGALAGGIVCHTIDRENSKTEIGYWLAPEFTGRGLATRACRRVIDHLFEQERLHRVEIWCAGGNRPSRAVAERLGFTLEGVLRQSDYFNNAFHDYAIYGILASEWQANRPVSGALEERRG